MESPGCGMQQAEGNQCTRSGSASYGELLKVPILCGSRLRPKRNILITIQMLVDKQWENILATLRLGGTLRLRDADSVVNEQNSIGHEGGVPKNTIPEVNI